MTTDDAAETAKEPDTVGRPGRRWHRWVRDAALALAVIALVSAWQERNLVDRGRAAPAFALRTLDGARVDSQSFEGRRVLVHFWATWCGVCRMEHDTLNAVHDGLSDDELLVSIVADADDLEHVRDVVAEKGIRYPVLLADDAVLRNYRVGAFPTNYYLDAETKIRDHTVGMSLRWAMSLRLWAVGS